MKKPFRSAGVVTLLLIFAAAAAIADDITVPGDYATIQLAIDNAMPGDRIVVTPNTYSEALVISNQALTLSRGLGAGSVIVQPLDNSAALRVTGGANVWVEEFILEGGNGAGATPSVSGEDGGEALFVNDSTVVLLGCALQGGDGGNGSTQFIWLGGDGGDGMVIQDGALVCGMSTTSDSGAKGILGSDDGEILVATQTSQYVFDAEKFADALNGNAMLNALEGLTADSNDDGELDAADAVWMVNRWNSVPNP